MYRRLARLIMKRSKIFILSVLISSILIGCTSRPEMVVKPERILYKEKIKDIGDSAVYYTIEYRSDTSYYDTILINSPETTLPK